MILNFLISLALVFSQSIVVGNSVIVGNSVMPASTKTITLIVGGTGSNEAASSTTVVVSSLTWSVGDLIIATCNGANGITLSIADLNTNSWTAINSYGNHFQNNQWETVVASGKGGTGITVTCSGSGGSYMILNVTDFRSSTGWPAAPLDKTGHGAGTTTTAMSVTNVLAPGANANAIELNLARWGDGSVSGDTVNSPTANYSIATSSAFSYVYYKVTSSVESAVFSCTLGTADSYDGMITTLTPN
jgi:hypothetical protein